MSNHAIQTVLGKSAFPGKPVKPPRKPQVKTKLDLDGVQKCRDPYKPERVIQEHKYEQLFKDLKEGDCFRVPGGSKELSAFARALRVHLERNAMEGIVRQSSRTEDGIPRVWLRKLSHIQGSKS